MWKDLASYIIKQCPPSAKIVEVGAGKFLEVGNKLQKHSKMNVILTDIKPSHEGVVTDDITQPNLKIYEGACIIYAIRPPMELHQSLMNISIKVGATLIIKPLAGDDINTKQNMRLVNYERVFFYVYP
ncbi:MAG: UPF0146 family protein [Methanobacteriaceae archaeon]|nr:UPF0146 family protein [Methanobacteriaceae archaeon]